MSHCSEDCLKVQKPVKYVYGLDFIYKLVSAFLLSSKL